MSGLSHPHIVRVHGSFSVKGGSSRFIVMELCKCTLNGLMRLRGPENPMPLDDVLRVRDFLLIHDDPWIVIIERGVAYNGIAIAIEVGYLNSYPPLADLSRVCFRGRLFA